MPPLPVLVLPSGAQGKFFGREIIFFEFALPIDPQYRIALSSLYVVVIARRKGHLSAGKGQVFPDGIPERRPNRNHDAHTAPPFSDTRPQCRGMLDATKLQTERSSGTFLASFVSLGLAGGKI